MSDPNSASGVLEAQNPTLSLARENEDLRRRLAELENNVVDGGFRGEMPRYQLNGSVVFDDVLFEKGAILETLETPNLEMVPLNDPAKRAMAAYIEHLEYGARKKATLHGRDFTGLVTDRGLLLDQYRLDEQAKADAPVPVIQVPKPIGEVPAMPNTDAAIVAQRRGPGRPRKAVAVPQQTRPAPDPGYTTIPPRPRETDPANPGPAIVGRMVG